MSVAGHEFPARGLVFPAAEAGAGASTAGGDTAGASTAGASSASAGSSSNAPSRDGGGAPIIVISHLRSPNCSDGDFALVCPKGTTDVRYDEGMAYLGEALSKQGFTVLIPDLGALLSGAELAACYDQVEAWTTVVGALLKEVPGDHSRIGLVAHSRSAAFADAAVASFGADAVLTYGGFYDETSPAPTTGQTPVLALVPELDSDVGSASLEYVAEYPASGRFTAVSLPGFGHMLVNRAAPDERVGCDELTCADAATHEKTLVDAAGTWFGHYLLGNADARFEAPSGARIIRSGGAFIGPEAFSGGEICRIPAPMSPDVPANPCPDAESGAVIAFPDVDLLAVKGSISVDVPGGIVDPRLVLAPLARASTPVRVELTAEDGRVFTASIDPLSPAILMGDEVESGAYFPSDVTLSAAESPVSVQGANVEVVPAGTRIASIKVDAPEGVLIRGVVGE